MWCVLFDEAGGGERVSAVVLVCGKVQQVFVCACVACVCCVCCAVGVCFGSECVWCVLCLICCRLQPVWSLGDIEILNIDMNMI